VGHLLVIEDDWRLREVLMNVLSDAGHSVDEARDGGVALERVRERRPDAVVINPFGLTMSGSGFLAARRTDPVLVRIPVVMSSTHPEPLPGMAVCLKKPCSLDDLLGALRRCLQGD
jgi:CheY-like chemotaxis protein